MRVGHVIGAAAFALALAGCGKQGGDALPKATAPVAAVPAPAGRNWTETVVRTSEGGFLMGNPNAPVKLVEFGSMSCSHCAEFAAVGVPALQRDYVASGKVSYEFRNYIRDGMDLALAMLARCSGPDAFFPLSEQMFAAQPEFFAKAQAGGDALQAQLQAGPPGAAKALGIDRFAEVRGMPAAKVQQCLAGQQDIAVLEKIRTEANSKYDLTGTPTFLINGTVVPATASWEQLEPQLKAAVG